MTLGYSKDGFLKLPTPLERLEAISRDTGVDFWIKRDDLTDPGMGGNKLRKLEYFIHDALDKKSTLLLTTGAPQTNHGRLTAAVAAKYGMKCAIVSIADHSGEISGNILLDRMMGAEVFIKRPKPGISDESLLSDTLAKITRDYEDQGEKVYFIPMGGSSELGILGYYDCAKELALQIKTKALNVPKVFCAVGSMGTYMGLFCGIKNENIQMDLTGIAIAPFPCEPSVWAGRYFERIKGFYGSRIKISASENDFDINHDWTYGAYNNPVSEVREAIYYMARREAIILDPCYTGKTFNGILKMIDSGLIEKNQTVIFIHTGGTPGINSLPHRAEMESDLKAGFKIF